MFEQKSKDNNAKLQHTQKHKCVINGGKVEKRKTVAIARASASFIPE
jgi:hypothetical protein